MSTHYDNLFGPEGPDAGDPGAWERTVDALYVTLAEEGGQDGALDDSLRRRLEQEGARTLGGGGVEPTETAQPAPIKFKQPAARSSPWLTWTGWAAAAAITLAFLLFNAPLSTKQSDTARLTAMVNQASDTVSWPFAGTTDEFKGSSGTVYWSSSLQKGYMKLKGVPVNVSTTAQYQLWIVDPARDKHPIDGGVFDIASGEVIVPIDAKLNVGTPAAFAITREKPGGVVVSAGPLLLVAKP